MSISERLTAIAKTIPPGCTLIAVSKTQAQEAIMEAYHAGHRHFGENKVQELTSKFEALPKDIQWHLIGHLQTNKAKYIVPFVSLIHSVDSLKLLLEINKQGEKINRVVPCLLQVHIAKEDTKFGFSETEIKDLMMSEIFTKLNHIQINGLMGMATFTENREQVRTEFQSLKSLFDHLTHKRLPGQVNMKVLSMGMSGDYQIALQEGSTMVRVGTAIFGERQYAH